MIEVLVRPTINGHTIGKNMSPAVVREWDESKKTIGDVIDVLSGKFFAMQQHLHYVFYFRLPPDTLLEIMCYTNLRVSRDQFSHDIDEGLMSGSIEEFCRAGLCFCKKGTDKMIRAFFNLALNIIESDGVQLPFIKTDLGDQTYLVKPV